MGSFGSTAVMSRAIYKPHARTGVGAQSGTQDISTAPLRQLRSCREQMPQGWETREMTERLRACIALAKDQSSVTSTLSSTPSRMLQRDPIPPWVLNLHVRMPRDKHFKK